MVGNKKVLLIQSLLARRPPLIFTCTVQALNFSSVRYTSKDINFLLLISKACLQALRHLPLEQFARFREPHTAKSQSSTNVARRVSPAVIFQFFFFARGAPSKRNSLFSHRGKSATRVTPVTSSVDRLPIVHLQAK